MRIISIDPGKMTGYCYAEIVENVIPSQLNYYPFQMVDDVDELWHRLAKFKPRFIIIEDFEFRRGKRTGGLELFPVQLIGVARLYSLLAKHQCAVFIQKAAQGKSYYTDPLLKQLDLYRRGIPHGMDASRHLLQWCMFGAGNKYIGSQRTEEFANIVEEMDFWNK